MKKTLACSFLMAVVLASFSAWAQPTAKPVELKFSTWSPPVSGVAKIDQKMCDMIMEKSQGRIKITTYFGETLLKMPEAFRGVQSGQVHSVTEAQRLGLPLNWNERYRGLVGQSSNIPTTLYCLI